MWTRPHVHMPTGAPDDPPFSLGAYFGYVDFLGTNLFNNTDPLWFSIAIAKVIVQYILADYLLS